MATIEIIHILTLFVAAMIIVGILSSLVAARIGAPLLLIFLVVGMLVGEDGPGQIPFNDYGLTYLIGSTGLAIILFDGGLRTRLSSFRGILVPSVLLATAGVTITATITGLVAAFALNLSVVEGLLVGAMVASTDAAAVFFLLRTGGIQLRTRVRAMLEIESGTNDPFAIFLTLMLVSLVLADGDQITFTNSLLLLLRGALLGAVAGLLGGWIVALALNRVDLPGGLHPLFVIAAAISLFALTELAGGSGYLAVYLAGLIVGNRPIRASANVMAFHDTATWLCQIAMFIVLGMLVTPSKMVPFLLPALAVALVLTLIARPVAVFLCLAPFRFSLPEQGFIAWVGLRGAVSIFLAAIATLAAVPNSEIYFNVVFVVVIVSLVVQGWTINPLARYLGIALPRTARPVHRVEIDLPGQLTHEMVGYPVTVDSPILDDPAVPAWARPVFVVRDDRIVEASAAGPLKANDYAYFLAPPERVPILDRLFAGDRSSKAPANIPQFPISANARLGFLADLYGATVAGEDKELTVAELFERSYDALPQIGDRLNIGELTLVVRAVDGDKVSEAAILLGGDADQQGLTPSPEDRGQTPAWVGRLRGWLDHRAPWLRLPGLGR